MTRRRAIGSAAVGLAGIPASMFPRVVAPGQQVGVVSAQASKQTGLTAGVPVLAGASDGLASLIGSGASEAGHANTTLGTTLVWKVLTPTKPRLGPGMYCHHLPNNLWVPGAASNTGPGSLQFDQSGVTPAEMDRRASPHLPTSVHCYLLGVARGAISFPESRRPHRFSRGARPRRMKRTPRNCNPSLAWSDGAMSGWRPVEWRLGMRYSPPEAPPRVRCCRNYEPIF